MLRLLSRPINVTTVLLLALFAGYGLLLLRDQAGQPQTSSSPMVAFEENGVAVAITLELDAAGQSWLVGTFTPLQEHFHLYSKDLPRMGINGVGRPTLLEVASFDQLTPIGELLASPPAKDRYSQVQAQSLPAYPDGPVTLRLPIQRLQSDTSAATELSVTYMACSLEICLTPVIDKRVSVPLPNSIEQ